MSGLSEEQIAQALTQIEHRMFVDIQVSELLQQAWSKPKLKHKAPNVVALITRFNVLSLWFVYAILAVDKFRARVRFVGKLINILIILFRIGNFNTGYALAIALTHSSIVRLKHTFSELAPSLLQEFEKAKTLIVPDQGYRRYRQQLKSSPLPKLPYLGLILADLVLVEEGNPDNIDGLIHFKKRELIYNIILDLRNTQSEPYRFNPDRAIVSLLTTLPPVDSSVFRDMSRNIEAPGVEKSQLLKVE